jgi:hypothetical protein
LKRLPTAYLSFHKLVNLVGVVSQQYKDLKIYPTGPA